LTRASRNRAAALDGRVKPGHDSGGKPLIGSLCLHQSVVCTNPFAGFFDWQDLGKVTVLQTWSRKSGEIRAVNLVFYCI
jgi:hypothetical protein